MTAVPQNLFLICNENEVKTNKQTLCEGKKLEEITAFSIIKVAFSPKGLLFRFLLNFFSLFRGKMDEKQAKNSHFLLKLSHVILNLVI